MKKNLLKIQLSVELSTNNLNLRGGIVHLTMPEDAEHWESKAEENAQVVMNAMLAMLGESISRVSAYPDEVLESEVFINIENEKLEGGLYHELIEARDYHIGWSTALVADIREAETNLRKRLSEMLYYLAREYYIGDVGKEGEEYGFFPRH
ncbi:hypothetical protein [Lutispora sp.]|uniref:hypothetical protein n=1 Tax=Lutispora sp. TaxID=2828727 RepID=UPI002B1ED7F2|nr:hypothetical protein [Lutispora sp.]MEA4960611.1 hypothetical protein [Lutispora sp.]